MYTDLRVVRVYRTAGRQKSRARIGTRKLYFLYFSMFARHRAQCARVKATASNPFLNTVLLLTARTRICTYVYTLFGFFFITRVMIY